MNIKGTRLHEAMGMITINRGVRKVTIEIIVDRDSAPKKVYVTEQYRERRWPGDRSRGLTTEVDLSK